MGNPLFHGDHWHSIYVLPIVNLMIYKVFIVNECTFEGKRRGKEETTWSKIKVSSLNEAIEQSIKVKTVSHRFCDDNVDLCIKFPPTKDFHYLFHFVLFDYLPHHIHALLLCVTIPIYNAVNFSTSCTCCENRV